MEDAICMSIAKRLCTKDCIAPYTCGHKKARCYAPAVGSESDECPIKRYDAFQADPPAWWEVRPVTLNDLWLLCENCGNTVQVSPGTIRRTDLRKCLDCPVKAAEESIQECLAEM